MHSQTHKRNFSDLLNAMAQNFSNMLNIASGQLIRKKQFNYKSLDEIVSTIKTSQNIVVITGAGISTSLGIPDFRSKGGLYEKIRVEFPDLKSPQDVFSIDYFDKNPVPFFRRAAQM